MTMVNLNALDHLNALDCQDKKNIQYNLPRILVLRLW